MTSPQQWIALGWAPLDAKYRAKKFGKPDPNNPLHRPSHPRPWKDSSAPTAPNTAAGTSNAQKPSIATPNGGADAVATGGSMQQRSASPSAACGTAANKSQSQANRLSSAEAPQPAMRRGVVPRSYDADVTQNDATGPACELWLYDVELDKYETACSKSAQVQDLLEEEHSHVMRELRELASGFVASDDADGGAMPDAHALATAGITAYSGVLQMLQTRGHNIRQLTTLKSRRAIVVATSRAAVEAATQAVAQRKADLECELEARRKNARNSQDKRLSVTTEEAELEIKHIVECMPDMDKEKAAAKEQEVIGLADIEPVKAKQLAEMTEFVLALRGQFEAARVSCLTDGGSSPQSEAKLPIGLMDEISDRLGQLGDKGLPEMAGGGQKTFLMQVCAASVYLVYQHCDVLVVFADL